MGDVINGTKEKDNEKQGIKMKDIETLLKG